MQKLTARARSYPHYPPAAIACPPTEHCFLGLEPACATTPAGNSTVWGEGGWGQTREEAETIVAYHRLAGGQRTGDR